jgi:hypothetical protein
MAPTRPRPEDDLYAEDEPHYQSAQIGRRPSVGQGWTIDVPDHLGQKGRDSMREQLDRIWDEFRAEQPLSPTAAPPPHLTRRYEDGREEPRPRWREPQHITRVPEVPEDRPQRDTRRAPERSQEQSSMEAMEERLSRTLMRSMEDMERRQEARESREATVTNPRPVPEIVTNRGLAAYTSEGEPSNLTVFTNFTKSNPVHFKGQLPTPFAYGQESLREFRTRYTAFAVASGWSGPNQVSIMLRCLEQGPLNTFLEWIEKGFLRGMDVDRMWRLMEEKFCDPGSERRTAKSELARRPQERGESTLAYEQVFLKLAAKAGLSEEEKVEKWLENIHPSAAKAIRLLGAEGGELTFERAAKIGRRVDLEEEERPTPLQTAVRRSVHAVAIPGETATVEAVLADPEVQSRIREVIREAISGDIRDPQTGQREGLKRKWDTLKTPHLPTAPTNSMEQGPPKSRYRPGPVKLPTGICHRCGAQDHMVRECTWVGKCDYCGRENHQVQVCYERIRAERKKDAM